MTLPALTLKKSLVANCLNWFLGDFRQRLISPLEITFPNFPLPGEVRAVQLRFEQIQQTIGPIEKEVVDLEKLVRVQWRNDPKEGSLFKKALLLYRRFRAAYLGGLRAKTFDRDLDAVLAEDIVALDAAVNHNLFGDMEDMSLPKLTEFLPLQLVEESSGTLPMLPPRAFDEKFRILFAPALFLQDLAYFRAKCEVRDTPVAIAFLDIDDFKPFNEKYGETMVDRCLLPRLMQAIEAHIHHHGTAYRQGGDEYLLLMPNLSRQLTFAYLDELRQKVAALEYPGMQEKITLSIGYCIADPDCPLTDGELQERANEAKKKAKSKKNCLATYCGSRYVSEELQIMNPVEATKN